MLLKGRQTFAAAGLDALGNKYLLQSITEHRRRDLRTIERALGRIQHDQHSVLRLVRRHEAHEGSDVFTGSVTTGLGQLLGRTGFTGDAVALDTGSLTAA